MSPTRDDVQGCADHQPVGRARIDALLHKRPLPLGVLGTCIAHDIASPLTYIRWDVDALTQLVDALRHAAQTAMGAEQWTAVCATDPKLERMISEYPTIVEHIRGGLDRLQALSRDLGAIAHDDAPPGAYNVHDAVTRAIRLVRPYVARRLIVEVRADDALPLVHGSQVSITLAAMNIAINAAQAQSESSGQGRLDVTICQRGDDVLLRFADAGPGIAMSPASRVFEPFVAGDADDCGLGLAFVRKVVTEQGGAAVVESDSDGTTVTLRLPISRPP